MSKQKKYFILGEEVSKEQYAEYIGKIATEGEDCREYLEPLLRARDVVGDIYHHKSKESLIEALRNEPELFFVDLFREFLIEVLEGKTEYAAKTHKKETVEKAMKIRACVNYYVSMGINKHYISKNKMNAIELVSQRLGCSEGQVKKLNSKSFPVYTTSNYFGERDLESDDGALLFVLNGFKVPESESCIQALENRLKSLTQDQYEMLRWFGRACNAQGLKKISPKNQDELDQIKKVLSGIENYEEVMVMQIREISL